MDKIYEIKPDIPYAEPAGQAVDAFLDKQQAIHEERPPAVSPSVEPPFSWREPLAVLLAVALADATIYHGAGFAGCAALIVGLALLFQLGTPRFRLDRIGVLFTVFAVLIAAKLIWCGNRTLVCLGLPLVFLLAANQSRFRLELDDLTVYFFQSLNSGWSAFRCYGNHMTVSFRIPGKTAILSVLAPLAALVVFGTIFVFANPDLADRVSQFWTTCLDELARISEWVPAPLQIMLWIGVAYLIAGMLRPRPTGVAAAVQAGSQQVSQLSAAGKEVWDILQDRTKDDVHAAEKQRETEQKTEPPGGFLSPLYAPCRNTLWAVILLFIVYLIFEFDTLWFRDFPDGFNYSRYMHQGAAYLTLALAVSTLVLSSVFRGRLLDDSRIKALRRLAWIWSALNFVLAIAVYNRLFLYIDLNGLSRLRVIGLLGVAAVVLGFIMVVRKIALTKSFNWLLHRFAWSVLAVFFIGMVAPVDWYIGHHNTQRVMRDDLLPAIFLLKNLDSGEELLATLPLLDSKDETIQAGARAVFAEVLSRLRREEQDRNAPDLLPGEREKSVYRWTAYQIAETELRKRLEAREADLREFLDDPGRRDAVKKTLYDYTNCWI